jgi:hypothetical protein
VGGQCEKAGVFGPFTNGFLGEIMKERGIPMSGMNIAPIQANIKTHTRRAMKNPPSVMGFRHFHGVQWERLDREGRVLDMINCRYGEAGDQLWVREAWRTESDYYNDLSPSEMGGEETILYEADGDWSDNKTVGRYRHSMFMPRWASRIDLEITEIRVERLQDISEADAKAEGVEPADCCHAYYHAYCKLWESINGAGSWNENPFVWVISFRRIK